MTTYSQNNTPVLNKKAWQNMGLLPVATAAGMNFINDGSGVGNIAMYMASTTSQYLYHHDEDGFVQITSGAFAGTFAAGACGVYHPWSITYTATGGSTTTLTVAAATHNLTGFIVGETVEFLSGANIGLRRTVTRLRNDGGAGTITVTFDQPVTAVANNDTFRISTGRFFVLNAYTALWTGVFKVFDLGSMTWQASLATTNLPAAWGTDGSMVLAYGRDYPVATGFTSSATSSTLTDSTKSWTVNRYAKHTVRIKSGTGIDEVRNILSNTATTLTIEGTFTATLDTTSEYVIEGGSIFATGTATSATNTTLVNSAKNWAADQWINYRVRITGGTGIGQVRKITDNDATSLTVATWTVNPDSTSTYAIEGNEDVIYLMGNAVVTAYTYTLSTNAWAVITPSVARNGTPTTCLLAEWIGTTGVPAWADENDILDGQYIYSPRGAATATMQRYKISNLAWSNVTYAGADTFTTGASCDSNGKWLYIIQAGTGKVYKFSVRGNYMEPVAKTDYTQSTAVNGAKMWLKVLPSEKDDLIWLYNALNTSSVMQRLPIF